MKSFNLAIAAVLHVAPCFAVGEIELSRTPIADEHTVLLLHFDENETRVARDGSGKNHHGKINGAQQAQGKFGKALRFDGDDDFVDCGGEGGRPAAFDFGDATDFTVEFWMNTTTTARWSHLLNKKLRLDAEEAGFAIFLDKDKARAVIADGQNSVYLTNDSAVCDGAWHHVALVAKRKGDAVLFVDGQAGPPLSLREIIDVTNERRPLRIGDRGHDGDYNGLMDEVRLSNIAREFKQENRR